MVFHSPYDPVPAGLVPAPGIPEAYGVRRATAPGLTAEDLMAYVAARVPPYEKVRAVEFIGGVPRAASGKILRRELRDRETRDRT
ncbi:hypothetical protein ACIRQY_06935 [Streptomyces sp. NPDC101490]|uniref:hypothetical protein n=1 Tax=Streptomyces sp. NPDC101490 TaxID=3366143 RepID=UPI0037F7669D